MSGIWRTIRGYILWSYERGTIQYDVMVTLILLFVFFSPKLINFKDRPVGHNPQPTGVVVYPDSQDGFIYQVEGRAVRSRDQASIRRELVGVIEPIAGEISISRFEPVTDKAGHVLYYKVWVHRP